MLTFSQNRFIVTLGWILDKPLTLLFDPFQSIALFLSGVSFIYSPDPPVIHNLVHAVLTVNYVVQDGRSNWLEGMILMCAWLVVISTRMRAVLY